MQMIDVLKRLAELDAKNPNVVRQNVVEGSDELYQNAIRSYTELVARNCLAGGSEYIYGVRGFDSEMFGVEPKQAQKDFDRLFPQYLKKLQDGEQGVAEGDDPGRIEYEQMKDKISSVLIKLYDQGNDAETIKQMGNRVANYLGYDPNDFNFQNAWISSFTDASLDGLLDQDDDGYTDYTMRQGEMGRRRGMDEQSVAESQMPMDVKDKSGKSVGIFRPGQGFAPNEYGRKTYGLLPTDTVPAKHNFIIRPQTSLPKKSVMEDATLPQSFMLKTTVSNPNFDPNADEDSPNSMEDFSVGINYSMEGEYYPQTQFSPEEYPELEVHDVVNLDTGEQLGEDDVDWNEVEEKCWEHAEKERDQQKADYEADRYDDRYYESLQESLKECTDMMTPPMQPKTPASINMTAGSGEELSNMLKDIMSLAGVHKVEPDHLGHDHEPKIMSTPPTIGVVSHNGGSDLMRSMMDKLNDTDADMDREEPIKELDNTPNEEIQHPSDGPLGQNGPAHHPNTPGAAKGRALMANPHGTVEEQLMAEWKNFISESQVKTQKGVAEGDLDRTGNVGPDSTNTDDILQGLTSAFRVCLNKRDSYTNFKNIETVYDLLRDPLMKGDLEGYEKMHAYVSGKYPDTFDALMDELPEQGVAEGRVMKSHMGETEYNTYSGWKTACRRAGADRFDGDKDICQAMSGNRGIGEWDGVKGTVYNDAHKKKMLDKPLDEKRGVPAHKEKQDKTSSERADAFVSKGGKVTQLPYKEPKEKTKWGSKHIGTGKGTRGEQMGTGARSSPRKPVVGEPAAKSDKHNSKKSDKKHDK